MGETKKFNTLVHNGVVFPEPFQAEGLNINGHELSPLAEEMLKAYAAKIETDYVKVPIFNTNFFKCLKPELPKELQSLSFPQDFMRTIEGIHKDQIKAKEKKDLWRKEHKDEIKKASEERKEKYGYAYLDGVKQPLGAFLVESPGIFIARGNSPLLGLWKYRVEPEDISINFVSDGTAKAPEPPEGHQWKEVVANTNVYHIAEYKENIGNKTFKVKEVRFAMNSSVKASADEYKFEKAVHLLQNMDKIEALIRENLDSSDLKTAECAFISWLLMNTGIRIGNPRDAETEANDIVGASTLKKENIWVDGKTMYLKFKGKDSVFYNNSFEVPAYVAKALKRLHKGKKDGDEIFHASSADVSSFLKKVSPEFSPKLFRTAIASKLLVDAIKEQKIKKSDTLAQKLAAFDKANLSVAKKLNHQKAISKNYDAQVEKMGDTLKAKESKHDELLKKTKKELKSIDDKIETYKSTLSESDQKVALKKLMNKKKLLKERIKKSEERIQAAQLKLEMKEQTKNFSIGTSRTNYCTPQIAHAFAKKYDVPIEKIYSKTLLAKFDWAKDTPASYFDNYPNV